MNALTGQSRVELPREERGGRQQDLVGPLELADLAFELLDPGRFGRGGPRGLRPASMPACLHQPRMVSGLMPTRGPIRLTAAFSDNPGSCSRASRTSRCARSRSSSGYFLGAGTGPLSRGFRASINPGAVQSVGGSAA